MNATPSPPPRSRRRAALAGAVVGLALTGLSGCSALGPEAAEAHRDAASFVAALDAGRGEAACALVTDSAREAVEETTGVSCAEGILTLGIDGDVAVSPAEVYSRAALVWTGGTAVFLTPGADGWLIRAAGCEPVEDAPFDCALDGS